MAKTSIYVMKTTSGAEMPYTHEQMMDMVRQYLKQKGNVLPTREDILAEIPNFVSRFKLIDSEL